MKHQVCLCSEALVMKQGLLLALTVKLVYHVSFSQHVDSYSGKFILRKLIDYEEQMSGTRPSNSKRVCEPGSLTQDSLSYMTFSRLVQTRSVVSSSTNSTPDDGLISIAIITTFEQFVYKRFILFNLTMTTSTTTLIAGAVKEAMCQ